MLSELFRDARTSAQTQHEASDSPGEPLQTSPLFKAAFAQGGFLGPFKDVPSQNDITKAPVHHTESVIGAFCHALVYSAVEAPVEGLLQIGNKFGIVPDKVVSNFHLVGTPQHYAVGSKQYIATIYGGGVGTILPFIAVSRVAEAARAVAAAKDIVGISSAARFLDATTHPVSNIAVKGALYEGLLHPNSDPKHFWRERGANAVGGAASMALLGGFAESTGKLTKTVLGRDFESMQVIPRVITRGGVMGVGGFLAGGTNYSIDQTLTGQKITPQDFFENAAQGMFFGVVAGQFSEFKHSEWKKLSSKPADNNELASESNAIPKRVDKPSQSEFEPPTTFDGAGEGLKIKVKGNDYIYAGQDANAKINLYKLDGTGNEPAPESSGERGLTNAPDPADTQFDYLLWEKAGSASKHLTCEVTEKTFEELKQVGESFSAKGKNMIKAPSGKVYEYFVQEGPDGVTYHLVRLPDFYAKFVSDNIQTPWTPPTQPSNDQNERKSAFI